jgi:hypothetical protein
MKNTQQLIKAKLRGKWFWKSNLTYTKPKTKEKTSLTKELRNKKGYDEFLKLSHSIK